jgi:hypothetical protein
MRNSLRRFVQCRLLRGQLIVEALVAICLLAIFAVTFFVYLGTQLLHSNTTTKTLSALSVAQEGIAATRAIRDIGWSSLATGTHGLAFTNGVWGFQGTSDTLSGFTRSVTVTELSPTERRVVTTIIWDSTAGRPRTTELVTNLTDWRHAVEIPEIPNKLYCDWTHPRVVGTANITSGVTPTGDAVRNKIAYISSYSSTASKPDFYVIDATSSTNPVTVASINTGSGLNDIALKGSFAYAASRDSTNQLQIINVSATSSPQLVMNYRLGSNVGQALSIAATGTLVLVGTVKDGGPELFIVDVSNPTAPFLVKTMEIGDSVGGIAMQGNYVYLATYHDTKELWVIDITNPYVPVVKSTYDIPYTTDGYDAYANPQDGRVYITRQGHLGKPSQEVSEFDVTDPVHPVYLSGLDIIYDTHSIFVSENLFFFGFESNPEFQIYDNTTSTNPVLYATLDTPNNIIDLVFEDNLVYAAMEATTALRIITSTCD